MLFSCTEKLEIKPKQSIDAEVALTTPDNIKAALVGAYLQASSDGIFGSYFNEYSELYAATTDLRFMGTYEQPREFYRKEATTTNSYVEFTWTEAYSLINTCNTWAAARLTATTNPTPRCWSAFPTRLPVASSTRPG